jgi:hypothetical protein
VTRFALEPTPVEVSEEVLADLRRRLLATKWPLDAGSEPFLDGDDAVASGRRQVFREGLATGDVPGQVAVEQGELQGRSDVYRVMLERWDNWSDDHEDIETVFTKDDLLTHATIYWAGTAIDTSIRTYANNNRYPWTPAHDRWPVIEHARW